MSDEHSALVEEIRKAILSGALSKAEMEGRLKAAIIEETTQQNHPADSDFLDACLDLLSHLKTNGRFSYMPDLEGMKGLMNTRYDKHVKEPIGQHMIAKTARVICAVAVMLVAGSFGTLIMAGNRLSTSMTSDEQQFVVEHQGMPTEMSSYADEELDVDTFFSGDLEEVIARLRFDPHVPMNPPEGWSVEKATAVSTPLSRRLLVVYADDEGQSSFICEINKYDSTQTSKLIFEQDQRGELIKLGDDAHVYHAKNVDHTLLMWIDQDVVYSIYGNADDQVMLKLAQSIIEGAE